MSVLSRFIKWLKGEKPPPTISEIRSNLIVLEMRLNRHEKELSKKRKLAIKKIRKSLKERNIELAREHAKEAILIDRDLVNLMKLRSKLVSIRSKIERGMIMQDLAENLKSLVPYFAQLSRTLSDTELNKAFMELSKASERMSVGEEILETHINELAEEEELNEAANQLVQRIAEKEGISIPETEIKETKVSMRDVERLLREVMEEED